MKNATAGDEKEESNACTQLMLFLLLCLPATMSSASIFTLEFLAPISKHRCLVSHCDEEGPPVFSANHVTYSLPKEKDSILPSSCLSFVKVDNTSDCEIQGLDRTTTELCSAWVFDTSVFSHTAVEDFQMVCSNSWRRTLAQTVCMIGMLVGSLVFGRLGDRLGRKPVLTLALAILVLAGLTPVCAPSTPAYFPAFLVSRFFAGFGGIGTFLLSLCLALEYVDSRHRYLVGILIQVPFTFGGILIALVSWAGVRSWKELLLSMTLPNLLLLSYWKLLPESPLWVTSCAMESPSSKTSKGKLDRRRRRRQDLNQVKVEAAANSVSGEKHNSSSVFSVLSWRMVWRSVTLLWNWAVVMLTYFGITMTANTFYMDNIFMNYILVFAADFPSHLACILGIERLGRKHMFGGCQILAGLTFLVGCCLPQYYQVLLTLVGKLFVSASLTTMFIYTAELYPTRIRNTAVGTCSLVARLGGILAPQVVSLQSVTPALPFLIFGSLSLVGGILIFWLLPETLGEKLPETLQDAEDIGRKPRPRPESRIANPEDAAENLLNSCHHV